MSRVLLQHVVPHSPHRHVTSLLSLMHRPAGEGFKAIVSIPEPFCPVIPRLQVTEDLIQPHLKKRFSGHLPLKRPKDDQCRCGDINIIFLILPSSDHETSHLTHTKPTTSLNRVSSFKNTEASRKSFSFFQIFPPVAGRYQPACISLARPESYVSFRTSHRVICIHAVSELHGWVSRWCVAQCRWHACS